ncbi:MAG: S-layer protein, partial [Candidatus ainarchaeum sp.]|nr:S-layer protein [Candidatus ainarchaeum sp.]
MKNINMKKVVAGVAALGVSALLAGSVVAANVGADNFSMNITKDTMYNNGVPSVSVVVGSMAQPVDVVWAGNIAAAIGKKAYTTAGTVGGAALQDVTIEVGSSSTSTVSGDGLFKDDADLDGSNYEMVLDSDDYSLLHDADVDVDEDYAGADELTIEDKLEVNAKVAFDDDKEVGALTATILKDAIEYTVDFDEGIKKGYDDDDASPELKFNFMGSQYVVDTLNTDLDKLTLIKNKNTQTYAVGDSFEVDGYSIEVSDILDNGNANDPYEAQLTLKDSEGNIVATDVFQADDDEIFEEHLTSNLDVDSVYATIVKIISGTSGKLELVDGDYIEDFPNNGDEIWKVNFTDDGNYLTNLTITNNDSDFEFKDEEALRIGDSIDLPNDFASIEFMGLTTEETKEIVVEDNVISYVDDGDDDQELFVYERETGTLMDEWTTDGEINGFNLYFDFSAGTASDVNFTVQMDDDEGDYLQSNGSWNTTAYEFEADDGWNALSINSDDAASSAETFRYGLYVDTNTAYPAEVGLGLAVGGTAYNIYSGSTWVISAIDTDLTTDTDDFNTASNYVGYVDATTLVEDDMEGGFKLTLTTDSTPVYAHFDAYTGDLVDTEHNDYEGTNYQVDGPADLGIHDSDDLKEAYTDFGTYYMIDSGMFKAVVPEAQLYGQFFIGGGSSSETTLNGGELVLTTPGTVVETEDGMISAKLITSTVTGGEEMTAMTPANWNASTQRIVYLDNETMT